MLSRAVNPIFVSAHHIYNVLQRSPPDVVEILTKTIWCFDRKGQVSEDEKEWIRKNAFYLEKGEGARVCLKYGMRVHPSYLFCSDFWVRKKEDGKEWMIDCYLRHLNVPSFQTKQ